MGADASLPKSKQNLSPPKEDINASAKEPGKTSELPVYIIPIELRGSIFRYFVSNQDTKDLSFTMPEGSSLGWSGGIARLARLLNQRRRQRKERMLGSELVHGQSPGRHGDELSETLSGKKDVATESVSSWELMANGESAAGFEHATAKKSKPGVYSALKNWARRIGGSSSVNLSTQSSTSTEQETSCPVVPLSEQQAQEALELTGSSSVADPQELTELEHYTEFLEQAEASLGGSGARHLTRPADVARFIDALIWLLHETEQEPCSGCVLLFSVDSRDGENVPPLRGATIGLSLQLPAAFRQLLTIPVISWAVLASDCSDLLRMAMSPGITDAVVTPIPIKPGDHIYREIREKGTLKFITHHGIYMGNGRIIHFSGNEFSLRGLLFSSSTAKIRVTSIARFMAPGGRLRIQSYNTCDPDDVVLNRAERALVEQSFPDYDMFRNNCEHFCHYLKTGVCRSRQVERGAKYAAAATAVVATAVVVGLSASMAKRRAM